MIKSLILELPASGGHFYWQERSLAERELFSQTAKFVIAFLDGPPQKILESEHANFQLPAILCEKPCQEASGYFWAREKRRNDGQLESHVTDFKFLIKRTAGSSQRHPGDLEKSKISYTWDKLRFSTCWGSSGISVLLCHDIGQKMQARMRHNLIGSGSGLHRVHAFSPHTFVTLHVMQSFDEAVWAWRGRVRELEIERQRKILNSYHESSNMHETTRHLIHCSEMLVTAMSTIQQMGKKAVAFPVFNHSADNSTVKNDLDFHTSLLTSYLNRSKALEARMQNEISLIFHASARYDSAISAQIADAAKRDGETMRTLSTLGVVFLPGTFVSSLFGMNFFDYSPGDTQTKAMTVSSNFWIFWAISVPLTISVILTWYVWQAQQLKLRAQRKDYKLPEQNIPYNGRQM